MTLNIALVTLGNPGTLTGGYLYHQRMAEMAAEHDARVTFVSFPELPFPLSAALGWRVLKQLKDARPDVVVLDSIAAAFMAPWTAFTTFPLVAMLHQPPGGVDHGPLRRMIQDWLDRRAYRSTERMLVASEPLATELTREGFDGERITIVPPGRDVSPLRNEVPLDLKQGRRAAFLCVANWLPNKGIDHVLEAFATLPQEAGTLHLVGNDRADPAYAANLRQRLSEPDLRDRVEAHGPVSRSEVSRFYRSADVFVLASARETYGTAAGEAMAAGLPLIAYESGNLPYLLEDGREGFLIPLGDIQGLAAAMRTLFSDPELRRQMGDLAKLRAEQRPTWRQSAAAFFVAVRDVGEQRYALER